ncbi:hypothetical protein PEDI_22970 [Persicobacter diffluens]|uniref:Uncharacterized protein n=1 Tax=Persicobacter diffluens TaxID=981 RepID=A0AAN4W0L6_9BACT|nr:hypothetical protein PEDI_22970 [Persicobacter diffluens]
MGDACFPLTLSASLEETRNKENSFISRNAIKEGLSRIPMKQMNEEKASLPKLGLI